MASSSTATITPADGDDIAEEQAILRPAGETGAPFARRRHRRRPSPLRRLQDAAEDFLFHRPAGAERDAGQRIVGDGDRQAGLVAQHLVEPLEQRAAAGQHDALVDDVGGKLRRGVLERDAHALDDRADRLATAPRRSGAG